jgi:hypothetical protein
MTEGASTSKTSVNFYQKPRRNQPEDSHHHTRRRENLKSHKIPLVFFWGGGGIRQRQSTEDIPVMHAASRVLAPTNASQTRTVYIAHLDSNPADTLQSRGTWAEQPAARALTFICLPLPFFDSAGTSSSSSSSSELDHCTIRSPVRLPPVSVSLTFRVRVTSLPTL